VIAIHIVDNYVWNDVQRLVGGGAQPAGRAAKRPARLA
jgi:hypothetical protein